MRVIDEDQIVRIVAETDEERRTLRNIVDETWVTNFVHTRTIEDTKDGEKVVNAIELTIIRP